MQCDFKPGDVLECVTDALPQYPKATGLMVGQRYTVTRLGGERWSKHEPEDMNDPVVFVAEASWDWQGQRGGYDPKHFRKVEATMLSKAITWLKDWFGSFSSKNENPHRATDSTVLAMQQSAKATDLARIARYRNQLKERLEQAKRQKKARKHLYAALEELTREELKIEAGQ